MKSKYTPYLFPTFVIEDDMQAYTDRQPRMMATFERHAEVETAFFQEAGLMCKCDVPNINFHPTDCENCGLPWRRETVLKAELNVPER
jgi:hypothetical protein